MTNLAIGTGQHMLLAVLIIITSIACLRGKYVSVARIIQLLSFAAVMLIHTHLHMGQAWIAPYHRLLYVLALSLAALFVVLRLTANKKLLYPIASLLFVASVLLAIYIEPPAVHDSMTDMSMPAKQK